MQHDNMKLHAILSKFHIEHTQNRATVQHTHMKQVIITICPKQKLGILQASNNMLQDLNKKTEGMGMIYR